MRTGVLGTSRSNGTAVPSGNIVASAGEVHGIKSLQRRRLVVQHLAAGIKVFHPIHGRCDVQKLVPKVFAIGHLSFILAKLLALYS